jgi:glutathione S-transferase
MIQSKSPPFTLYEYRISPFCIAIRIALHECKASFTPRDVDLKKPRTVAFLRRSPFGRLPALVEHRASGELSIFESTAILLFLSERFPKSTLGFSDLFSKAQGLSWLSFISGGFSEIIWNILNESFINKPKNASNTKIICNKMLLILEKQLKVLERHLARRAYLSGDYSIADTLATPILDLLDKIQNFEFNAYPYVFSWRKRLRSRISYKGAWPYLKT